MSAIFWERCGRRMVQCGRSRKSTASSSCHRARGPERSERPPPVGLGKARVGEDLKFSVIKPEAGDVAHAQASMRLDRNLISRADEKDCVTPIVMLPCRIIQRLQNTAPPLRLRDADGTINVTIVATRPGLQHPNH